MLSLKLPDRFPLLLGALFFVSTCIKVLLIPSYRSTDFEVHRNWLAITHSLPVSQWYYENTSQWTLDYPPFFAWFEWVLSHGAAVVDPLMVNIQSLNYASSACVLYQRFTVMGGDLTLLYALFQYYRYQVWRSPEQHCSVATRKSLVVSVLMLLNYGLLSVDHVHFQYNGFLFGILLLSVVRVLQGRYLEGGFWFAVVLNFKHIFLYLAPAYFVCLLKDYCFLESGSPPSPPSSPSTLPSSPPSSLPSSPPSSPPSSSSSRKVFSPANFTKLGTVVVVVFLLSFGPFLWLGQLGQVVSRLFPFKRGLCHAYWAPNVWALYGFMDMLLGAIGPWLGLWSGSCDSESGVCGSMTSGLVGEMAFKVLPKVAPWVTVAVTALAMLPSLVRVWFRAKSSSLDFLKVLVLCAYSSFLFGWHVHEKAILLITIPMSLLAVEDSKLTKLFMFLSVTAHISLFPLLHQRTETGLKMTMFFCCTCMTFLSFGLLVSLPPPLSPRNSSSSDIGAVHTPAPTEADNLPGIAASKEKQPPSPHSPGSPHTSLLLSRAQTGYVAVLLLVQVYCEFLHSFGPLRRFQFLPLLLTSVSCAVAVVWSWGHFLTLFLMH